MRESLQRLVSEWESDPSLGEADLLLRRMEILDRIDAWFPDADASISGSGSIDACIKERALAVRARLEAANVVLCRSLREEIRQGICPAAFQRHIQSSSLDARELTLPRGNGYDYLDELVSGVLQFDEPSGEPLRAGPESVFYQPTPARHVFALIATGTISARDVLFDLGSGLGHVSILASICTGARSIGIELEPSLAACAASCARRLNLNGVSFLDGDARNADLSAGTVFYLYTPFVGATLRAVLDSIRRQAAVRSIRVCTFGPCAATVAEEAWLAPMMRAEADRITVFESRG